MRAPLGSRMDFGNKGLEFSGAMDTVPDLNIPFSPSLFQAGHVLPVP